MLKFKRRLSNGVVAGVFAMISAILVSLTPKPAPPFVNGAQVMVSVELLLSGGVTLQKQGEM